MVWLLDANVAVAHVHEEHEHHGRVERWLAQVDKVATCPIIEGALVRYLVRMGASGAEIRGPLASLANRPGHEFWPDDLSYTDADLSQVIGHRQVTDAYLVSLVRCHGQDARLATLDQGLALTHPDAVTLVGEGARS